MAQSGGKRRWQLGLCIGDCPYHCHTEGRCLRGLRGLRGVESPRARPIDHRKPGNSRSRLLDHLNKLQAEAPSGIMGHARHIATRARETSDQAIALGIAAARHDNRNHAGGGLRRYGSRRRLRHDDVDL